MLAKHVLGYLPGTVLSALFGFLSLVVYTRLLEPAQFGRYALVLATAELIQMTCFEWVAIGYQRFHPEEATRERLALLRTTTRAQLTIMVTLVSAAFFATMAVTPLYPELQAALWSGLPIILLRPFVRYLLADHRASMQIARYSLLNVGQTGLGLAFGFLLVGVIGFDERGALIGLAFGAGVAVIANGWQGGLRLDGTFPDPGLNRNLVHYGLPLVGFFAFESIRSTSDRFFIEHFLGTEAVGQFMAFYLLISRSLDFAFTLVQPPMNVLIFATMASEGEAGARARLRSTGAILLFMGLPAAVGVTLIAEPLARIVIGAKFTTTLTLLAPCISAAILISRFRSYFYYEGFHLAHRNDLILWTNMPAAALMVGLSIVLIPRYGLDGAVLALVVSDACALCASAILVRRVFAVQFPLAEGVRIVAATMVMGIILASLKFPDGVKGLAAMIALGIATFGLASLAVDTIGLRRHLLDYIRSALR